MSFYEYIKHLQKYLHSIRHLTDNGKEVFAIDMKFPARWNVLKHCSTTELAQVKEQKKDEHHSYITFFSISNESGINETYDRVIFVIDKCIEEEKKAELLNQKIKELKEKFNELSLDELQQLVFKTKEDERKEELQGS
jgi:hypothetical protein